MRTTVHRAKDQTMTSLALIALVEGCTLGILTLNIAPVTSTSSIKKDLIVKLNRTIITTPLATKKGNK